MNIVKVKVIHLLRRIERIDRDLEELDSFMSRLQDDRGYAGRLKESAFDEIQKLKTFRARLLTQVIKSPPRSMTENIIEETPSEKPNLPHKSANSKETPLPEIHIPSRTKIPADSEANKNPIDDGTTNSSSNDPQESGTVPQGGYKFVFDRKDRK